MRRKPPKSFPITWFKYVPTLLYGNRQESSNFMERGDRFDTRNRFVGPLFIFNVPRRYNEMNAMLFPEYKVNCFIRPDDHHAIAGDVSSKDSVSECFKQILEKYKRAPDIVVNSAGITKDGFLLRMKEEDFEQVMLEGS